MAGLFISYRRADSGGQVGRLVDRLSADKAFRHGGIFLDVNPDVIELGANFRERIRAGIGLSSVVLAVIGNQWLTISEGGVRRLDREDDAVREEIRFALQRGVTTIPVLVGGAAMPKTGDLPEPLRPLADLNGTSVSDARFDVDLAPLVEKVKRLCEESPGGLPPDVPAETYFTLGYEQLRAKNLESARACFQAAVRLKPDYALAYVRLATTLQYEAFAHISENNYGLALERLTDAQQALKEALPYAGADPTLLVQMGFVYKDLVQSYSPIGRIDEANAAYEQARYHFDLAFKNDPQNASAVNGLASIAIERQDYDEAARLGRTAIELQPRYVAARHDLALAYYGQSLDTSNPKRRLAAMQNFLDTYRSLNALLAEPGVEQLPQQARDNLQNVAALISREVGAVAPRPATGTARRSARPAKRAPQRKPKR